MGQLEEAAKTDDDNDLIAVKASIAALTAKEAEMAEGHADALREAITDVDSKRNVLMRAQLAVEEAKKTAPSGKALSLNDMYKEDREASRFGLGMVPRAGFE